MSKFRIINNRITKEASHGYNNIQTKLYAFVRNDVKLIGIKPTLWALFCAIVQINVDMRCRCDNLKLLIDFNNPNYQLGNIKMKSTRLTAAARQQIAMKATKSKYKAAFDDAKKLFAKSARDYIVENSLHKEALLCSEELRMMIPTTHSILFPRVYFEKITASIFGFSGGATSVGCMQLHDMVYAAKTEKISSEFPAYIKYKNIIREAGKFYFELLLVLNSYKTLESAAKQLPWLSEFAPPVNESSTSLIDIKQIERINDLMKGVKQ